MDTQVLVYACHHNVASQATGQLLKRIRRNQEVIGDKLEASAHVFRCFRTIYVSTITIMEFVRSCDPVEIQWVNLLGRRLVTLPADRQVAETAARLFRERQRISHKTQCPVCLNSRESHPCRECKKHVSAYHKIADSLIVATAEVSKKVGRLYSYDGGILDGFAQLVKQCEVANPPAPPPPAPIDPIPTVARPAIQIGLAFSEAPPRGDVATQPQGSGEQEA